MVSWRSPKKKRRNTRVKGNTKARLYIDKRIRLREEKALWFIYARVGR